MSARREIVPVFIPHLGCPHTCVFCNQREITGMTADLALQQLRAAAEAEENEEKELALYGGSFTAIPEDEQLRCLEIAKGHFASIRISTRPDAIDAGVLKRLREYSVGTVELGAQSMRDEVLLKAERGHTAQDVREASRMIREAGFSLVLQMMTGLPGDDDAGALYTAKELIALKPDAVRIYPTVVIRGTELERRWREGSYRAHTVEDAVRVCAQILPLFEAAGIPVIRLGLNPTDELSAGSALAGAYHPALGELVRSRILRDRLEAYLRDTDCDGEDICIAVPRKLLSQAIGQKKSNLRYLKERFQMKSLTIIPSEQESFCVFKSTGNTGV